MLQAPTSKKDFLSSAEAFRFRSYLQKRWFGYKSRSLSAKFLSRTQIARSTAQNWFAVETSRIEKRHLLRVAVVLDPDVLGLLDRVDAATLAHYSALSYQRCSDLKYKRRFAQKFFIHAAEFFVVEQSFNCHYTGNGLDRNFFGSFFFPSRTKGQKNLLTIVAVDSNLLWTFGVAGSGRTTPPPEAEGVVDRNFLSTIVELLKRS